MPNELTHYGVLGMKWGVRKDPVKAHAKASKKLRKLDKKVQVREKQHNRREAIANARLRTLPAKKMLFGKSAVSSREVRRTSKAIRRSQTTWRQLKKSRKLAENWYKKMEKTFANVDVSTLNPEDVELGKRYAAMLHYKD